MIGIIERTAGSSHSAATRRRFLASLAASLGICAVADASEYPPESPSKPLSLPEPVPAVIEQVIPSVGARTAVTFNDSIQKLIAAGVIDPGKFRSSAGESPPWVERLLSAPSNDPIVFNRETARYLVDLLWPIGVANKAAFNENSPIYTVRIPSFASTGGWTLGRQPNGYVYFNKVEVVRMTAEQQATVLEVATTTYRPCCDNSTFFQDCNHGSALLGLLELAASQGATLEELYGIALTANSYWFADNYVELAVYFSNFQRKSWREVEPRLILSAAFSSSSGWETNVHDRLLRAKVKLPGGASASSPC